MELRLGTLGCACLLFLGFLLVGCTSAEEVESEAQKAPEEVESEVQEVVEEPIDTIEVQETEFSLNPSEITLDQPGTYVFRAVNSGDVVHALEIEGEGIEEESGDIEPGQSVEFDVNLDPGTYKLYCPVGNHEERGMVGTVTVEAG
jgi:plastocyanin